MVLVILASFEFRNIPPSSASAAYAATNLSIWHSVNIAPLGCIVCLSCGFHPRNKCPADRIISSLYDN